MTSGASYGRAATNLLRAVLMWPWALAAQVDEGWTSSLVSLAWDAGCSTQEECVALDALLDASHGGFCTQQSVASALDPMRVTKVLDCLRNLPEWQEVFRQAAQPKDHRPAASLSWRWDLDWNPRTPDSPTSRHRVAWRKRDTQGHDVGLRGVLEGNGWREVTASAQFQRARGVWSVGSLAGRFGQGLVAWTPGPFDDLGGIEGSHRLGGGLQPVRYRQRGVVDGMGWQRRTSAVPRGLHWSWFMLGRTWPEQRAQATMGFGAGPLEGAMRAQQLRDGRVVGVLGVDGKGQRKGWNWRWALCGFEPGWEGRLSVLKTWSRRWEAHALLARNHPDHPRWTSGEVRATPLDPDTRPGLLWQAGIAFRGRWKGWLRMETTWSGPPPFRWQRRTAFRLERRQYRIDFKSAHSPDVDVMEEAAAPFAVGEWSCSWRMSSATEAEGRPFWRWHLGVTGKGEAMAAVLACMVSWRWHGHTLRLGLAQTWGMQGAPIRYVQGWDGRPSAAFSNAGCKGYVRWRSADGQWQFGVQWRLEFEGGGRASDAHAWGIHAVRVEFRPHWATGRKG